MRVVCPVAADLSRTRASAAVGAPYRAQLLHPWWPAFICAGGEFNLVRWQAVARVPWLKDGGGERVKEIILAHRLLFV
jgi:hypothetical protein